MQDSATARVRSLLAEEVENDLFGGLAVGGDEIVAHLGGDAFGELVDAELGFVEGGFDGGEVKLDLTGVGEDGGLDVGELLVDGGDAGVGVGLGDEQDAEEALGDVVLGEKSGEA